MTTQSTETAKEEKVDLAGCELTLPLADWVRAQENKEEDEACPPCDLAVIAPWYRDKLKERGYETLAQEVDALADKGEELDALDVAETLDKIKGLVQDEATRDNLLLYDCMMQAYREDAQEDQDQDQKKEDDNGNG